MSLRDLMFTIRGRDESGRALNSTNRNLRETGAVAASVTDRIGRLGGQLAAAGAVGSVASFGLLRQFRESVRLYDVQARAEAKVAQAIRSTGGAAGFTADELFKQASALQDLTRLGDEQILGGVTAQLLTFKNISDDVFIRTQKVALDVATVLEKDLKSAALQLGLALNDPAEGLSRLSRSGITFTEAQEDLIKSLTRSGRLLEAQAVILGEIESQYGGQAEAALAGAGAIAQLSNEFGDLKEPIGEVINDGLEPLTARLRDMVEFMDEADPATRRAAVAIGALGIALPPVVAAAGALALTIGALGGPLTLLVTGLSAAAAAAFALSGNTEDLSAAAQAAASQIDAEADASGRLAGLLSGNLSLSAETARTKLEEARSRAENVRQIIAEQRALAQASGEFASLRDQIAAQRSTVNSIAIGNDADRLGPIQAEALAAEEQALANLLRRQGELLAADDTAAETLRETEAQIERLEAGIASARDGVVTFGDVSGELSVNVEGLGAKVEGLSGKIGGAGRAAAAATPDLDRLKDALSETETVSTASFSTLSADLRGIVTGAEDAGDAFGRLKDRIIDSVLEASLSPVFNQLGAKLSETLSAGGAGGSGGGFLSNLAGGLLGGLGLPGFNRGGTFTVGGPAGIDRVPVGLALTRGETVTVAPRGQTQGRPVNVVIQTPDPASFQASRSQVGRQIGRAVAAGNRNS